MKVNLKKIGGRIFSRSLQTLWVCVLGAIGIGLFWGTCYIVVNTMEKEQMQRVESSAQRDAAAVASAVANWEQSVADWADAVREGSHATLDDLIDDTELGSRLMGSDRLYLVDKTFYYYDNHGLISQRPEYDALLQGMEGDSLLQPTKDGTILVCWKVKPFSVEYNQFAYAMAEFTTVSLREVLAHAVNGEETYCGVLDTEGNFLVDGIEDGKSFYGVMDQAKIQGFKSAKDLRSAIARKEDLAVSCALRNGQNVIMTTPLPELGWTLLTIHPTTPVASLKNPVLVIAAVLCILLAAVVVAVLVLLGKVQLERMQKNLIQKRGDSLQQKLDTATESLNAQEEKHAALLRTIVTGMTSIMGYRALADRHRNSPNAVRDFLEKLEDAADEIQMALEPGWTPPAKEVAPIADENTVDLTGKRVLLVEDNELNRDLGATILSEAGMIVECAENGQVGFQKVAVSKPGSYYDLVLMDIQMPVMDGCEAARTIRRLRTKRMAEVPILALTASISPEDKQRAFQAGMDGYVEKPVDLDKLLRAIRNALSRGFAG